MYLFIYIFFVFVQLMKKIYTDKPYSEFVGTTSRTNWNFFWYTYIAASVESNVTFK